MKRTQRILLGVLAFQIILSVVVFWPREAALVSGEPLFPDLAAEDIVALTVEDNTGERIVLRNVDGAWVMPEAGDYPAQEANITPVLEKLVALSAGSVVARTEASHTPLQVSEDTFQRRVDFETATGETYTFYLGSAPRYTATHVRVEGEPETYLTSDLSVWDVNVAVSGWADTSYVSIDLATVTDVALQNANGTFILVKDEDKWTLADLQAGEAIEPTQTSAVVRAATSQSLMAPLGTSADAAYGLDTPGAVVIVTTDDGQTHTLAVAADPQDDGSYVVKSSDADHSV
ncbi:MAG: DUF4340 domain-containing protein, partial [Anaerolineae bacterium]|nr:DUF4340 domain-containing protein [Anaerolineae bacterium]